MPMFTIISYYTNKVNNNALKNSFFLNAAKSYIRLIIGGFEAFSVE